MDGMQGVQETIETSGELTVLTERLIRELPPPRLLACPSMESISLEIKAPGFPASLFNPAGERPRIRLPGTPHLAQLPAKRPPAGIRRQDQQCRLLANSLRGRKRTSGTNWHCPADPPDVASISWQLGLIPPVPEDTARVAHAAFADGHPYLRLRDQLGTLFTLGACRRSSSAGPGRDARLGRRGSRAGIGRA